MSAVHNGRVAQSQVGSAKRRDSGSFALQTRRSETLLPPVSPETANVPSLSEIRKTALAELDSLELRDLTPPPVPDTARTKTSFSALTPYHVTLQSSERAELVIEDLALRLDNPYACSSLVPPASNVVHEERLGRWFGRGAVACALVLVGYFAATRTHASTVTEHAASRVPSATVSSTTGHAASSAPVVESSAVASELMAQPSTSVGSSASTAPASASTQGRGTSVPNAAVALGTGIEKPAPIAAVALRAASAQPASSTATRSASIAQHLVPTIAVAASVAAPVVKGESAVASSVVGSSSAGALPSSEQSAERAADKSAASSNALPAQASARAGLVESSAGAAPTTEAVAAADEVETLAEAPTREQVMAALEGVRASLQTCAEGGHGLTVAKVTISGAGRVSYATIEGAFQGTPAGSCMARALRTAQFPRFSQPTFKVSYPFGL